MLKEKLDKLKNSEIFKDWRKENEKSHLAHVFILLDEANKGEWQIGYYTPETSKITTFVVGEDISQNPDEEVFKKPGTTVKGIDLDKVKKELDSVVKSADNLQQEKYKPHTPVKKIVILQNLDIGQVWNVTYVTSSMQTLNIKIDSETGEIKEDKLVSLIEFKK